MTDYRALCAEALNMLDAYDNGERVFWETWKARARAALAQPEPAEGEVAELVAWLRGANWDGKRQSLATRAADLLEQRHPAPVPVSERLPGPDDCDADGKCWWYRYTPTQEWHLRFGRTGQHNHWLPANAMPLPAGEVE